MHDDHTPPGPHDGGRPLAAAPLLPGTPARRGQAGTLAFGPVSPVYAIGMIAELKGYFRDEGLDSQAGRPAMPARSAVRRSRPDKPCSRMAMPAIRCSSPRAASRARSLLATEDGRAPMPTSSCARTFTTPASLRSRSSPTYKRPDGAKPIVAATAIGSGTWVFGTYVFESRGLGDKINWVAGGGAEHDVSLAETKQFDAIMAPPAGSSRRKARASARPSTTPPSPACSRRISAAPLPVLVVYTLAGHDRAGQGDRAGLRQRHVSAMQWVKAAPIDEVYALVADKYFAGIDPVAVKAETRLRQDRPGPMTAGSTRPPSSAAASPGTARARTFRRRNTRTSST